MKKLFALAAVVMLACATVSAASTIFNETFSTRRGGTYIVKAKTSFGDAWPYASQWFTGYEAVDAADNVVGNQYDKDYTNVSSSYCTVRGKKLNSDNKNTVGLYFGAKKTADQCYVLFEGAFPEIPEGGALLKLELSSQDGSTIGDISAMVVKVNDEALTLPEVAFPSTLGETVQIQCALPAGAMNSLYIAFNNIPGQKFISNIKIDTDAAGQGIENVEAVKAEKFYRNGQLIIRKNGVEYNVLGAEVR